MQKFIKEMDVSSDIKYKKPIIITLSGLPGSGKTTTARGLSKNLGIFLFSTDYIRNYYFIKFADKSDEEKKKIPKLVKTINKKRLVKLLLNRTSFVIDQDLNSMEAIEKYHLISKVFGYNMVSIKLDSKNDSENIQRIQGRVMNYDKTYDGVIGDNVEYQTSYPSETYFEIKKRKPQLIDDNYFDFVIDNNKDLQNLENQIETISYHLNKRFKLHRINA